MYRVIGLLVLLERQCKYKKYNENETNTKRMAKVKTLIKSEKITANKLLVKRYYKILFALILISTFSYAQPNPTSYYIKRVKDITEQLKTDSLNYKLIWERLKSSTAMLEGKQFYDVFSIYPKETNKEQLYYYKEIDNDFEKVYENVVKPKNFEYLEEGDYYLSRISFYGKALHLDKAIKDACFLRDSTSYSEYPERGDVYNDFALESLFKLFVLKKDYNNALEAINTILEKKKSKSPEIYFSGNGSGSSPSEKIKLFEYFNKNEEITPYLKQLCRKNFEWYFKANTKKENTGNQDSIYIKQAKNQSLQYLTKLVFYMKQFNDKELPKYETIYNQIKDDINGNYETINPKISDKKLKSIVSKI